MFPGAEDVEESVKRCHNYFFSVPRNWGDIPALYLRLGGNNDLRVSEVHEFIIGYFEALETNVLYRTTYYFPKIFNPYHGTGKFEN